jgi:hypothetical protein
MQAAAALAHPQDRVCEWFVEVERIADELHSLRPAARRAVKTVLGDS